MCEEHIVLKIQEDSWQRHAPLDNVPLRSCIWTGKAWVVDLTKAFPLIHSNGVQECHTAPSSMEKAFEINSFLQFYKTLPNYINLQSEDFNRKVQTKKRKEIQKFKRKRKLQNDVKVLCCPVWLFEQPQPLPNTPHQPWWFVSCFFVHIYLNPSQSILSIWMVCILFLLSCIFLSISIWRVLAAPELHKWFNLCPQASFPPRPLSPLLVDNVEPLQLPALLAVAPRLLPSLAHEAHQALEYFNFFILYVLTHSLTTLARY